MVPCSTGPFLKFSLFAIALCVAMTSAAPATFGGDALKLTLRYQTETVADSGRYHRLTREEVWQPEKTAIIVCDVWDLHHCLNAVRRAEEFAPRLNNVLQAARKNGVTIIHAPSDCMAAYEGSSARQRAIDTPKAKNLPDDITSWCSKIPSEEAAVYPIDQSDGGEDDDPEEHRQWAKKLADMGRNPKAPWKRQSSLIEIDQARDFISDRGDEVWSILEARGIDKVILTGVHTNMCVLGRPFGLRQMARNGKQVVLMRDMTDTMYNPQRWPYVSHFTGTDLIISHIEKFVCPTVTSNQILGDAKPFRFNGDRRPHVVIVMAEDEYKTNQSLPQFAARHLGRDFRVSFVFGSEQERNNVPGLEVLADADIALFSIRRRVLPPDQMAHIRKYVAAAKPVVGIRTASHAFSLRGAEPPAGFVDWPEFDAEVFGGNYHNHHGNKLKTTMQIVGDAANHPILTGVTAESFPSGGSLYKTSPVADEAEVLVVGRVEGHPQEPTAWTFRRQDGGRSFYTSLGHVTDFENPSVVRLLVNSLFWVADRPVPKKFRLAEREDQLGRQWVPVRVPDAVARDLGGSAIWYRCVVRFPAAWQDQAVHLKVPHGFRPWINGHALPKQPTDEDASVATFRVPEDTVWYGDANLIVVRGTEPLATAPQIVAAPQTIALSGRWQSRIGDDDAWTNIPLPAKFGGSTDVYFEITR